MIFFNKILPWRVMGVFLLVYGGHLAAEETGLSVGELNVFLKEMQRTSLDMEKSSPEVKTELVFRLGTEADEMALHLTRYREAYGEEQMGMLDLILTRIAELGIKIEWSADRQRYFYNGEAFNRYLVLEPEGPHAAESAYQLLEMEFFRSGVPDTASLLAMIKRKKAYIDLYPDNGRVAEVMIMLAIEYRDLARAYLKTGEMDNMTGSLDMAKEQARAVINSYPDSEKARLAERFLLTIESNLDER